MSRENPLLGKNILVVEDEFLVAQELADTMQDLGAAAARMTSTLSESMTVADSAFDGALVDVSLRDGMAFDLIDKLVTAGVPVILTTGYDEGILPDHLRDLPRLTKPFDAARLRDAVETSFGGIG